MICIIMQSFHGMLNEDGDKEKAMQYFNDTYNAFSQFDEAINKLQKKMQQLGYNDITAIVAFEK